MSEFRIGAKVRSKIIPCLSGTIIERLGDKEFIASVWGKELFIDSDFWEVIK